MALLWGEAHVQVKNDLRDWQLGSEIWIDPLTSLGRPSREDALINVSLRAQRALLDWLACDPEYCLPCSCQSSGQATRNIRQDCLVGVCRECDDNTRRNLPVACCLEMAGSNQQRYSAPPFRPDSTDLDVFREVVLRNGSA